MNQPNDAEESARPERVASLRRDGTETDSVKSSSLKPADGESKSAALPLVSEEETAVAGQRHTSNGGQVFLGGNFLELGVSPRGSFGTSGTKPGNFNGANPPGSNAHSLGIVADLDGFGTGTDAVVDLAVPDEPEERWSVAYNGISSASFSELSGSNGSLTEVSAADQSSGSTLQSTFTGTVNGVLKTAQVHTFGINDKYFKTTVTLTNVSANTLTDVEYMRSFDPDNSRSLSGSNTTVNVIGGQYSTQGYALVAATSLPGDPYDAATGTQLTTYFLSRDPRAQVYSGGFANRNPYDYDDLNQPYGAANTADSAIGIVFKVGNLAPGQSVAFSYYTGASSVADPGAIESSVSADRSATIRTYSSTNSFISQFNSIVDSDNYKNFMRLGGDIAAILGIKALSRTLDVVGALVTGAKGDYAGLAANGVEGIGSALMSVAAKSKIGWLYALGGAIATTGYVWDLAHDTDFSNAGSTGYYALTHPVETVVEFGKATTQVLTHVGATVIGSFGGFLGWGK